MKRCFHNRVLWVMAAFLSVSLTGCHQEGSASQDGIDYNRYVSGSGFYAYTDTAYLFYYKGSPIQFIDAALTQPAEIMCAKPDCRHNSVDCGAYINSSGLYASNNQLYYLENAYDGNAGLYEMDIGGDNRRQLYALDEMNDLQNYGYSYQIQGGYLLLDLQTYDVDESVDTLYLYPLKEGGNTPVCIFEEADDKRFVSAKLVDDWVFYTVAINEDAENYTLYGYKISTKETKLLHEDWRIKNAISLKEDTLYFSKEAQKLCRLDLNSGEITEFEPQLEQAGDSWYYSVAYDDQYFYLTTAESINSYGTPGVFIYTYEGELLQFIPYEDGQILAYCMTGPDVTLFSDPQSGDYSPVCYLRKADIEAGKAEFRFFEA